MEHFKVFEELKSTNSNVDKETILRKYIDDDFLAELLKRNLDPYFLMYIKKVPEYTQARPIWNSGVKAYKDFIILTDRLNKRIVTGNAAKDEVRHFLAHTTPNEAEIYKKILLKESIGVGTKTVNKVWVGLIPEFNLMLAPNDLPDVTKVRYPTIVQPKFDGFRCVYRDGEFWSRQGLPFPNTNLKTHFKSLMGIRDWVLDGELYDHSINFNKLQSILNNETTPIPTTLKYSTYDCLKLEDWDNQICKVEYQKRMQRLRSVINGIADHKKIIDTPTDLVNTSKEAVEIYKEYLKKGYEGAMLKDPIGLYKWKRVTIKSGEMLKLKPFKSVDLKIKEIYAGEGNFKGMAGGVTVDYNGVTCSCGSGFTLAIRKKMAQSPNNFIGKTIEIKYFEETEDGSLRFPTFVRFREDKD